jgi:peptide/nickel transport system substrate-binding protein
MGARSKAIDAMIAQLLVARDRDPFESAVRALDRVLISGFYVVPLFHLPDQWVARWTRVEHPTVTPLFGFLPEAWWRKPGT